MIKIVNGQDGEIITNDASTFSLKQSDKRYSKKEDNELFDFVGFIIEKEKLLTVYPKHFYENVNEIEQGDIALLFKVICKYISERKNNPNADKYIGNKNNFVSDYPFNAFFKIYDYYKRYGIYKEEENIIKPNSNGKISWKNTLQKSKVLISNSNLIFLPLYSKKKNFKTTFLGECMIYVINYTIKNFQLFLELPPIHEKECKIDFLANKEYTLRQLYQCSNEIFKDHQKKLINSLIEFFEQYDRKSNGGSIHFKINYFDMIWERMVNKYLNDCFVEVDEINRKLIFNYDKEIKRKRFSKHTFNDIDTSYHKFSIAPDHYYADDKAMYVFDSKYYSNIDEFNYKQFSYTLLLGNSQLGTDKKMYSALLLPGKQDGKIHIQLSIPYCQLKPGCNYIIEQFLDVKMLMKNYIEN